MNHDLEVVNDAAVIGAQERASIDMQIATAKRYPRDIAVVKSDMLKVATLDVETAQTCFYTLPKRNNAAGGESKPIQGPSIRLAEIALSNFGNIRAKAQIVGDDGKFLTAEGMCIDLEKNVAVSVTVKRRVTTKSGARYGDDMIGVTAQAACSIALRNAIFKVVPLALVKPVYDAAMRVAIGDARSLSDRRARAFEAFSKMGISKERVLAAVEAKSEDDLGLDKLQQLLGFHTAIKDGEASLDEIFPEPKKTPPPPVLKPSGAKPTEPHSPPSDEPAGSPPAAVTPPSPSGPDAGGSASGEAEMRPWERLAVKAGEALLTEATVIGWAKERRLPVGKQETFPGLPPETAEKLLNAWDTLLEVHQAKEAAKRGAGEPPARFVDREEPPTDNSELFGQ